jgi:hypothetical protein
VVLDQLCALNESCIGVTICPQPLAAPYDSIQTLHGKQRVRTIGEQVACRQYRAHSKIQQCGWFCLIVPCPGQRPPPRPPAVYEPVGLMPLAQLERKTGPELLKSYLERGSARRRARAPVRLILHIELYGSAY